jgi:hypothetical protein
VSTPPAFSKVWLTMSERTMFESSLDLLDHLGVGLLHVGNALHDLDLLLRGQPHQDLAGLLRRQVRQDQRDRLRVLVLDEREEVFRLGLLEERERRGRDLLGDLLDGALGIVDRQRLTQQRLGILQPALGQVCVRERGVVELAEDFLARAYGDLTHRSDLARHLFDCLRRQTLEDLRCLVLTQRQ